MQASQPDSLAEVIEDDVTENATDEPVKGFDPGELDQDLEGLHAQQ